MLGFEFRGTIADIDETTADEPFHPATVLIIETGDVLSRLVVPQAVLQNRLALLCVGQPVRVLGEVQDWFSSRGPRHIATELDLACPVH